MDSICTKRLFNQVNTSSVGLGGVLSRKSLPPSYSHCLSTHPFIHSLSQSLPKCLLLRELDGEASLTVPLIMAGLSRYPGPFLQHVVLPATLFLSVLPLECRLHFSMACLFRVLSPLPRRTPDT